MRLLPQLFSWGDLKFFDAQFIQVLLMASQSQPGNYVIRVLFYDIENMGEKGKSD